ncbi:MAG TPA: YIP1 family protein [Chloroflexia bacterium]|nr:YIP1 family protein [Chloroflexia bacterium]
MERLLGILTFQGWAYREIADDGEETLTAFMIVLLGVVCGSFLLGDADPRTAAVLALLGDKFGLTAQASQLFLIATDALLSVLGWFLAAVLLALVGMAFGGSGSIGAMLRTTGYAQFFSLLALLPSAGIALLHLPSTVLVLNFLFGLLGLIAYVVAVAYAAQVGTGAAIGISCASGCLGTILAAAIIFALVSLFGSSAIGSTLLALPTPTP